MSLKGSSEIARDDIVSLPVDEGLGAAKVDERDPSGGVLEAVGLSTPTKSKT